MAPVLTTKPNTKPLKPYRRGETLGKASRSGKLPQKNKQQQGKGKQTLPVKEERKLNGSGLKDGGIDGKEQEQDGDDEEKEAEGSSNSASKSGPKPKRKKGKKFVETQDALLSLVASITASEAASKKSKIAKVKVPKVLKPSPLKMENKQKTAEVAKQKRLDIAKAAVVNAKAEARKASKAEQEQSGRAGTRDPSELDEDAGGRKRVSFA
ncbi:hypothetical protein T439DRAFT_320389 [Meredithblackwellia eburnea MCA 4105]